MADQPPRNEQDKPFAPTSHRATFIDEHYNPISPELATLPRRKCIKFCGFFSAILLVLVTTILILTFTIFHINDPILNINSVTIQGAHVLDNVTIFRHPHLNLTLVADVSIKNPNFASFRFGNTATNVYYDGFVIGEAWTPGGRAKARRTVGINVTMDVMVDRIVEAPRFTSDLSAGMLPVNTYTRIDGKVRITGVIKRSFVVRLNCTMNINVRSSQTIEDRSCRSHVSF